MFYVKMDIKLLGRNKITLGSNCISMDDNLVQFNNDDCLIDLVDNLTGERKCMSLKDLRDERILQLHNGYDMTTANLLLPQRDIRGQFFLLENYWTPSTDFDFIMSRNADRITRHNFANKGNYYISFIDIGIFYDGNKICDYNPAYIKPLCMGKNCRDLYVIELTGCCYPSADYFKSDSFKTKLRRYNDGKLIESTNTNGVVNIRDDSQLQSSDFMKVFLEFSK